MKTNEPFSLNGKSSPGKGNNEQSLNPVEDEEDLLDEKEQFTFNKVMGDIQAQREEMNEKASSPADSALQSDKNSGGVNDEDDLDEDQKKALESILAQIGEDDKANKSEKSKSIKKKAPVVPETIDESDDIIISSKSPVVEEKPISTEKKIDSPAADGPPEKLSENTHKKNKIRIGVLSGLGLLTVFFIGYFLWSTYRSKPADTVAAAHDPVDTQRPQPSVVQKIPVKSPPPPSPSESPAPLRASRLKDISNELDQLRSEMIAKQKEIADLRKYYQSGIDTEIKGILDVIRNSGKRTLTLQAAINDAHIRLGLSAIQRRDMYIRQLTVPEKSLFRDSEELLYLRRKAAALSVMAEKTKDMDTTPFIRDAAEIIDMHRRRLEQINIDAVEVAAVPIETVWQSVAKWMPLSPNAPVPINAVPRPENKNEPIWTAICAGDFSKRDQLTELTPEAAQCLSRFEGKDLFLNNLTTLSPETARALIKWEGNWLGLNGLSELSPESAIHLARWNGKIISLNGLSQVSPQVVAALSEWKGNQIELVGLKQMPNWTHSHIHLFVPEELKTRAPSSKKWKWK